MPVLFLRGITDHVVLRSGSWIMAFLMLALGVDFMRNPALFMNGGFGDPVRFVYLQRILASQTFWGVAFIALSSARLVALTINGTFPSFPWSPHVRCVGAALACMAWFQIALATFIHAGSTTFAVYCALLAIDLFEAYKAGLEIEP